MNVETQLLSLATLLICCTLKLTFLVFIVLSWSKVYIQNEHTIIEVSDHSDSNSCLSFFSAECVEAQATSGSYVEDISIFRSLVIQKAEKELNRNLHKNNEAETSGFLHSSNSQHLSPVTTKHLSPTLEAAPKADLLEQQKNSDTKQNAASNETTSYATSTLPGATASHDQHYETNFDMDVPHFIYGRN